MVSVCLFGLVLWSAAQLIPLPEPVVGVVSPTRLEWHRTLLPEQSEVLPGEAGPVARPSTLPLTIDPSATRTFLVRVLGVLLVYLIARNWLATRESFRRLAWVLTGTGVALAAFALGQLFSSPNHTVYWSVEVEGGVFGPFVCRNHYPAFVALCMGMAVGLLLPKAPKPAGPDDPPPASGETIGSLLSPRGLGLAAAVGLMLVSIAFSLSRGGVLSAVGAAVGGVVLARFGRADRPGWVGWLAAAGVVAAALGVAGWFGTEAFERRLATVASREAAESRLPIWRDAVRLVPEFWLTGSGGGTFVWVEPTVRTDRPASDVVDHAHGEYLEAVIEGGVVRLGLTLALVIGVLVVVGRGVVRRRDRSVGPLLLGAWFGLAAGVLHAVAEFGIHMPAVAILTAVVAGYAVAAATDAEFVPTRLRTRKDKRPREPGHAKPEDNSAARPARAGWTARGWAATGGGLVMAGLALVVALDARSRERAYRLRLAADVTYWETDSPDRLARRAAYLDARAAVRPDDPDALFDAAQGHIDAAVEATLASADDPANPPDKFPPAVVDRHLVPALRYLRAARAANPLAPKPHARLALYAADFASSEPAAAHFDRAKFILPTDPDLWYVSGRYAFRHGHLTAAWADWRQSLTLSDRHLGAILGAARHLLAADELRERVLPDDPVILRAATDRLYPDRLAQADERRPFLEAAAALGHRPDLTPVQLAAVAWAHDELGQYPEAERAWERAVRLAPDDTTVRDEYSRWLTQEERYEEAIAQLEWLVKNGAGGAAVRDRLDAARHGLKLMRGVAGK